MEEITIFDKIIAGEIPADIVFENEHVLAFHDVSPQAPTHVLVIPKKKIVNVAEAQKLSLEELGHFMLGIQLTANKLGLEKNGYRVVMNNGVDAKQTVEYLHAHILGGRELAWPPG